MLARKAERKEPIIKIVNIWKCLVSLAIRGQPRAMPRYTKEAMEVEVKLSME